MDWEVVSIRERQQRRRRRVVAYVGALVALLAIVFSSVAALAATTAGAETRVGSRRHLGCSCRGCGSHTPRSASRKQRRGAGNRGGYRCCRKVCGHGGARSFPGVRRPRQGNWRAHIPGAHQGLGLYVVNRAVGRQPEVPRPGDRTREQCPAGNTRERCSGDSFFERELQYMQSRGYSVGPDGTSLMAPGGP